MRSDVDGKTLSPDNEDSLLRLGASLGWDTRDSWTHPRRGWLNEIEVLKTGGFLGGDGDFWTLTADLRRWQRTAAHQTLLVSGLVSYQTGMAGVDIPVYLDYRMGGANSIRGYSVEDLGKRLYGKSQLIGTVEYSFILMPMRPFKVFRWSLRLGLEAALFTDAGIAWSLPEDLRMNRARAGGGAGLRLLIPGAEMLRFDVGWSPEGGFQFHFAGRAKAERQRWRIR
jgi:outer membrane protein assembly factor BamA